MSIFFEMDKTYDELLKEKKNFLFIGEAGSGKSEIVLNTAKKLREISNKDVDIFDMDQSKPLYRSRDMAKEFAKDGITIHYQDQYLDAPVSVGGVSTSLISDNYTLLDIGGGHQASKQAGAYAHLLSKEDSVPIYILNSYRPWTKDLNGIDGTMSHILASVRLNKIYLLGNPNLGYHTNVDDFMEGVKKLDNLFADLTKINSYVAKKEICEEVKAKSGKNIFPIELFLTYSWVDTDN